MTNEQYEKATKLLEEKRQLENQIFVSVQEATHLMRSIDYNELVNKLFVLGQEFAAL
jgi:hypothetical protein